jgi:predicted nucleic acid-binding protein
MQLIVDANVLVAEALRERGRALIAHPALELFITDAAASETAHELRRRVSLLATRGVISEWLADKAPESIVAAIASHLTVVEPESYSDRLAETTWRIPRDPLDAPTVALALALGCGIWTNDRDFFGCGLAVWSTEVLRSFLDHQRNPAS